MNVGGAISLVDLVNSYQLRPLMLDDLFGVANFSNLLVFHKPIKKSPPTRVF